MVTVDDFDFTNTDRAEQTREMATQSHTMTDAQIANNPFVDVNVGDDILVKHKGTYRGQEFSKVLTVTDAGNYVAHRQNAKVDNALDARDPNTNVVYRFTKSDMGHELMRSIKTSSKRHDRLISSDFDIKVL